MRSKLMPESRRVLRERLVVWDQLSELSDQLLVLVEGYCEGGVTADEAEQASKQMRFEINRIEHLVSCWRLQREGRN